MSPTGALWKGRRADKARVGEGSLEGLARVPASLAAVSHIPSDETSEEKGAALSQFLAPTSLHQPLNFRDFFLRVVVKHGHY